MGGALTSSAKVGPLSPKVPGWAHSLPATQGKTKGEGSYNTHHCRGKG